MKQKIGTNMLMFLFFYNIIIAEGSHGPNIYSKNGEVEFIGYDECSISVNKMVINSTNGIFPGIHFGLIEYTCDKITGKIISRMSCMECRFYCTHNQNIVECSNYYIPLISGFSVGAIFMIILIYVLSKNDVLKRISNSLENNVISKLSSRKSKNARRLLKKIRDAEAINNSNIKMIGSTGQEDIDLHNEDDNKGIMKRGLNVEASNDIDIGSNSNGHLFYYEHEPEAIEYKRRGSVPRNVTILSMIIMLSIPPLILGCDNTFFLNSEGKVCDYKGCQNKNFVSMPLMKGNRICVRDSDQNILAISITESNIIYRHHLMYYTTDYEIDVKHHTNCLGAGKCDEEKCNLISDEYKGMIPNNSVSGNGCSEGFDRCSNMCFYSVSCTFYSWYLKEGKIKYPVYTMSSQNWEVSIAFEYLGARYIKILDVNNPDGSIMINGKEVKIGISSFTSSSIRLERDSIIINNTLYLVDSSFANMPETDKIGDYQLAIDGKSRVYNTHNIRCQTDFCKTTCASPEPKINRFISSIERYRSLKFSKIGNSNNINVHEPVNGLITMNIGDIRIESLQVIDASCDIEVMMTYSCVGCDVDSYAVVQAYNIKQSGIIPITSTCNLVKDYISCEDTINKIEFVDNSKVCYISMKGRNDTIKIMFNTTYLGSMDPSKSIYATSSRMDDITGLVTSSGFINGIISTIGSISLFTIIGTFATRLIGVILTMRSVDKESYRSNAII
ncbi:glycoprotein precursor [Orthophasmavirus kigluaikense]|uniref:Glycoprotein n=104 Tax=Orthophasmavirus kigluaikense TaxID=3052549 RepID=A0A059XT07_9VIRU|nr:glycoprotein precursor [Orthophasmavirus kigluaikense]AIA24560.1 glycoprotein precursor [Orthophasmavirus kigluaikense]